MDMISMMGMEYNERFCWSRDMATDLIIFPLSPLTEVSSSECPPLLTAWLPGRVVAQVQGQVQEQVQGRGL